MRVGLVSPGAMGAAVGAAARQRARVLWASAGRSAASRSRARDAGLEDVGTLAEMVRGCEVLLSVCPPEHAVAVAEEVAGHGFAGVYVDANAVAPGTSRRIGAAVAPRAAFVDGGIVGPPPREPGTTRLYLAGERAGEVAALFDGTALRAVVVEGHPAAASALKMCYAAYTKGAGALLLAIRALASAEGVEDALLGEWATSQPGLRERTERLATGSAPKAWRFRAEMLEIAATFEAAGLPGGFHEAAADVFERLEACKDTDGVTPEEVTGLLLGAVRDA